MIYSDEKSIKPEKSVEKYYEAYNRVSFYKDLLAHDINNILQNINSSNELIAAYSEDQLKSKKINELNEIIKEQVNRGKNLIQTIRKLSHLEKTELKLVKKSVHEVLKYAIEDVLNRFSSRKIKLKVDISDNKHIIYANEFLTDIFENILINAVIHNKSQFVEILIKVSKQTYYGLNHIRIEFIDNGLGITDKKKKTIFQSNKNYYNNEKGMGLGLSLVKTILKSYKGKIKIKNRVKDDYSKGSKFILLIPEAE